MIIQKSCYYTFKHELNLNNRWTIRLGDHNFETEKDDENVEEREIEIIHKHPKFIDTQGYYDVAVIKMAAPVEYSFFIRRICLPTRINFDIKRYDHRAVTVTGWGQTQQFGQSSSTLRGAVLTIFDQG